MQSRRELQEGVRGCIRQEQVRSRGWRPQRRWVQQAEVSSRRHQLVAILEPDHAAAQEGFRHGFMQAQKPLEYRVLG